MESTLKRSSEILKYLIYNKTWCSWINSF